MSDDEVASKPKDNPGQSSPEQSTQLSRQSQIEVSVQPGQREKSGRKPLFGN